MSDPIPIGARIIVSGIGRAFEAEVLSTNSRGELIVRRGDNGKRQNVKRSRVRLAEREPARPPAELHRTPSYEQPAPKAPAPKSPATRSPAFLAFVRSRPCMAPGCASKAPSEAHHWAPRGRGNGGRGVKVDDLRTVPLCTACHRAFHDTGALPGTSPAMTKFLFLDAQVGLLVAWHLERLEERDTIPPTPPYEP